MSLMLCFGFASKAQQVDNFSPGELLVSPALGLGTPYWIGYSTTLPPISVSVDYGIEQDIVDEGTVSIGGYFGIAQNRYRYNVIGSDWGWNFTHIVFGPRGTYTYPVEDKLDIYGVLMLGYSITLNNEVGDIPITANIPTTSKPVLDVSAGGRYFFQDNLAAMVEIGYGVSILRLGVSFRL